MALSHICPQCGLDLARTRTRVEPHYQLPIVRCPRCRGVQVRRKHPLSLYRQQLGRMLRIVFQLVWKMLVIYTVSYTLYYLMRGLIPQWRSLWMAYLGLNFRGADSLYNFFIDRVAPLISWWCAAVAGGAIVSGLLHHWKPAVAWGFWLCYLVLLISNVMLYDLGLGAVEYVLSINEPHFWSTDWTSWNRDAVAALMTFGCSLFGIPFGWMLVRAGKNRRQRKFRKRRIKRRRMQSDG